MNRSKPILKGILLAALTVGVVMLVLKLRDMRQVATETADDIEAQLGALDPVTRAAVVGKLSADAAKDVKAHAS
jgi:hypothetical protein